MYRHAANNYNILANTDDGSCTYDPLLITATVCDTTGVTSVRFTGPWWGWDPNGLQLEQVMVMEHGRSHYQDQ